MSRSKDYKMFKISLVTILIYFMNKVGCTQQAVFTITPIYNYGVMLKPIKGDKIYFNMNEGMRVECRALSPNGTELYVNWFEMKNSKMTKISSTWPISSDVYDARNKSMIITAAATASLEGRRFACGVLEEGLYLQYSSFQEMIMAYIEGFKFDGKPVIKKEDETGYLNCPVPKGAPEPEIEWQAGDQKIDLTNPRFNILSNGITLQILNMTLDDAGLYYCTARNMAGSVQSPPFNVTVLPKNNELQFMRQPMDTSVYESSGATLTCRFNRKITHGWIHLSRDGKTHYVVNKPGKLKISDEGDLIFEMTDRNDSGTYTCYGRDDDNNIISKCELDVNFLDEYFVQNLNYQTGATVGESATMTCLIPEGFPAPYVSWTKDESVIYVEDHKNITLRNNRQELVFKYPTVENNGFYQCIASNLIGYRKSVTTEFRVIESGERPQSFHGHSTKVLNVGENATVICSMLADPKPSVKWILRKGPVIIELPRDRIDVGEGIDVGDLRYNFSFTLKDVTVEDHKTSFTCEAYNKLGSNKSPKVELLVNHMTCRKEKLLQTKKFLIDSPANIGCPLPLSRYPREKRVWSYSKNSTLEPIGEALITDSLTQEDIGYYNCTLANVAGVCHYDIYLDAKENNMAVNSKKSDMLLIILITAFVFVVIAGVMLVSGRIIILRSRRKKKINLDALDQLTRPIDLSNTNGYEAGVPIQVLPQSPTSTLTPNQLYGTMSKFSQWQVSRDRLKILNILGEGQFGNVYKAELKSADENTPPILVAIKQIKDDNNPDAIVEYEKEMVMMTQLNHQNIVQLRGLCTDSPPYFILTEYMEQGNLRDFLQEVVQSKGDMLQLDQQVYICSQIASGLQYMSSKSFVHRDVAARNCLVGKDLLVKVADFGLSRSVRGRECYQKDGGIVPIRWMSPEAIQYGHYTTANDIWAFGITMWEVFSYGTIPYSAWSNEDVAENVQAGSRLIRPESCPKYVYAIMQSCWNELPEDRNAFAEILYNFTQTEEQQLSQHPQHHPMLDSY